ncbi:hypothetical protein [Polyangium jinanense]|uniref:Lipoprotein n=1 Tax=Polyangium jinanense TaxID=2829994 RepID=A0A9X3XC96_9BACT|nr:hypothetical protein [Polyangium jinanense]MDC3959219.1 hypothetical protein [Polyangium jinanense]MDC3987689.1 hypothetical protein [Polyangium jinanense]
MKTRSGLVALIALASAAGCMINTPPSLRGGAFAQFRARSPLANDEHIVFAPSENASILGRVLLAPYVTTRPLADQLAPNPCADALVDVEPRPVPGDVIEDAELLSPDAARAAGAPGASHVHYHFDVRARVEKAATKAYTECCQRASCGVGYVRSATLGEGEIALAKPTAPGGNADVAFDEGPHPLELTHIDRRHVRGFVAFALGGQDAAPPLAAEAEPESPGRATYDAERIEVRESSENRDQFELCTKKSCITENEFVRRYARRTGSHELDDYVRDRAPQMRATGVVLGSLGVLAAAVGVVILATDNPAVPDRRIPAVGGVMLGISVPSLAAGIGLLGAPYDGWKYDHYLTKSEARRFVERYNRALRSEGAARGASNHE